jgi:hypothetical protein
MTLQIQFQCCLNVDFDGVGETDFSGNWIVVASSW